MTRSDEDPEGDGADEEDTEPGTGTGQAQDPDPEAETQTEPDPTESPGDPNSGDSTEGKIPLSELREEVATDSDRVERGAGSASRDIPGSDHEEGGRGEGIPLSELRDDVVEDADAPETVGELFHEERVEEVDSESVWADLLMGSGETDAIFDPTSVEAELGREFQVVPKTLCHRCEFFGDPPTLHCTHEGTTIHETVDMDHYRVSECPMVRSDDDSSED